jgi:hypothetical protein
VAIWAAARILCEMKRLTLRECSAALVLFGGVLAAVLIATQKQRAGIVGVTNWGPDGHPLYAHATASWAVPLAVVVALLAIASAVALFRRRAA